MLINYYIFVWLGVNDLWIEMAIVVIDWSNISSG